MNLQNSLQLKPSREISNQIVQFVKGSCDTLKVRARQVHTLENSNAFGLFTTAFARTYIYLFIWGLRRFQHSTGHITTGSWKGRGNPYVQFVRVLYCKLPTNGKQLPAFPLEAVPRIEPRLQRWEARVLPLCHRGLC